MTSPHHPDTNFRNMLGPITLAIAIIISFRLSGTTYGEVALLTIVIYIVSLFILNREKIPYSPLHIFIYLFLFYIVINPFWSINYYRSISHIQVLCQIPLFFFLLSTEKIQKSWGNYMLFMPIPALISSIWGISEYIQTDQLHHVMRHHRVDGFLYDPNSFAAIQYIFSILLFSLLYNYSPRKSMVRWSIWIIQFLVISTLFLSLSRSGMLIWLLFILAISLYSLINKIKKLKKYITLHLFIALLSFIFVQILINQVDQPLVRDDLPEGLLSTSFLSGRFQMWEPTIRLIAERPFFGWGLNSFVSLYPSIREEFYSAGVVVHNDYIQFTLEGGIILLFFLLMYLGFHLYILIKLFAQKTKILDVGSKVELAFMLLANLALLLHSTINFSFYIIQLCILSGIIFARVYYLSATIGLIKQSAFISLTKISRRWLILLLTIIMAPLLYRSTTGILYINSNRYEFTRSLSSNNTLLNIFLTIAPLDHASSNRLAAVLHSNINAISDTQKKRKIIDYAVSILEPIVNKYPYEPINYYNLAYLLQSAYTQLPDHNESYKHYADVWVKSIEVDPSFFLSYLKLYDDLTEKKQYKQGLSIMERLIPWIRYGIIPRKNVEKLHEMLIALAEKSDNGMLILYKKLSLSAKQGNNKAYYDTLSEIEDKLKSRKSASETFHPIPDLSPSQASSPLPPRRG